MLDTAYSPYWLILFVFVGIGYAYLLYSKKKTPWQPIWNKVLFILRTLVVTLIAYLLLEPFLSIQKTESENSNIVFLWDDSESVRKSENSLQQYFQSIKSLKEILEDEKDVSVPVFGLSGNDLSQVDSIENNRAESPLNRAIKIISDKYNQNLISEVVLFSDGVYNKGIAPDYYSFPFHLSTVGLGDTAENQDIVLKQLRYNKVAYEGNQFPIEADLLQNGFAGESVLLKLSKDGKELQRKVVSFKEEEQLHTVQFLVEASSTGFQEYVIEAEPLNNEFNTSNNTKSVFIIIVEGKKKILLLAPYPHPDIKALSAAITKNENYDFRMAIAGIGSESVEDIEKYDLAILFHLPNVKMAFSAEIKQLEKVETPLWFVTGPKMNYRFHNEINQSVDLIPSEETDQAFAYINPKFDLFKLDANELEIQENLPPVYMPFANHKFHPLSKTFMMKQVGKVKTEQAVFVFYSDETRRQATLLIQNFRVWRMVEYLNTQNHTFFDDWVMKTIRYLTASNQKDRFKVFPIKEAFADNEIVKFQVEVYNEVFDRMYGIPVDLKLINERDSVLEYEFTPDRINPDFELGNLEGGVYEYEANAKVQGKNFEVNGQFVVEEYDLESQNLQANYNLLRRLSKKNEGQFFKASDMVALESYLKQKDYPKVLKDKSEVVPIHQDLLPYILIFLLVFSEWFIRRFFGSY